MPLHISEIRACLFDFGGTLDSDGRTWQDRFLALYEDNGVHVDREAFRRAFYYSDDTLIEKKALLGLGLRHTLEAQVSLVMEYLELSLPRHTKETIIRSFLEETTRTINRNRGLLRTLSRRYRMGIVSNFYGNLERVCEDLGIKDFFGVIVDSTVLGVMKPDPRIFRAALDTLGVAPCQAIYIGDNPWRDMEGAKAAGIPRIWLTSEKAHPGHLSFSPDAVISSLEELESLLFVKEDSMSLRICG